MTEVFAELKEVPDFKNKYGFSKKTNIAIVGITCIQFAKENLYAIIGITVITLVCVFFQYCLDRKMGV